MVGSRRRSPPARRSECRGGSSASKPEGTDEYLRNYWTHAERDLDGALTEHFHLLLHEDRYNDDAFCAGRESPPTRW